MRFYFILGIVLTLVILTGIVYQIIRLLAVGV